MVIPYLVRADNVLYALDGGPHKSPGTEKLNSSALESGSAIRGIFDFWRQGVAGSPTHNRVVYVNQSIYADDDAGTFTSIKSGLAQETVPHFTTFDELLIIANDAINDVPMSWDGTTFQDLAGSPPNFGFSEKHKNHLFAAGVDANPSNLYWSDNVNPESWTGGNASNIAVDPNDGSRITGIISHKGDLWIFKGPEHGSIHRVTGTIFTSLVTPADTNLELIPFIKGVGSVNMNSLFRLGDDIGFWWKDGTIRTLSATAAFGDFREASLTADIQPWLDENLNFNALHTINSAVDNTGRRIYHAIPVNGSFTPNALLVMDARFEPPRWSQLSSYDAVSIASATNEGRRKLLLGGSDGFVRIFGNSRRSIDGNSSIDMDVLTPYFDYGQPQNMKTLARGSIGINPKNSGNIKMTWLRDDNPVQTIDIKQTASTTDVLSESPVPVPVTGDEFTLGASKLGGEKFTNKFSTLDETGGEFRYIRYGFTNSTNGEDVEMHSFGAHISGSAESFEEI